MKKLYLLLFLAFFIPHADAQTTQDKCTQGACSGFGPPTGACVGSFIYSDISQTPVQAYSCKAGAWAAQGGGGGGAPNPITANWLGEYQVQATETGTQATDYSGAGHPCVFGASTAAPTRTQYGLNFVHASNQYCDTGIPATSAVTVSMVVQFPISYANGLVTGQYYGAASFSTAGSVLYTGQASTNDGGSVFIYGTNYETIASTTGYAVITWVRSSTQDVIYFNGQLAASVNGVGTGSLPGAGTFRFGQATNGWSGNLLWGDVYSTALTAAQIAQLAGYELNQVNVGKGYIAPPQNPTADNVVAVDGDSIPWGYLAVPFANYLNLTFPNSTSTPLVIDNSSDPSYTMALLHQRETRIIAKYPNNAANAILIVFACTNDIATATALNYQQIAAACAGQMAAHVRAAVAVGWKTFVVTTLDRAAPSTTFPLVKNALNTITRQNWRSWGASGLIDMAENPVIGADGASALTSSSPTACPTDYFNVDNIHPLTCVQHGIMDVMADNVINNRFGSSAEAPNVISAATYQMLPQDGYLIDAITANSTKTLFDCTAMTGVVATIVNQTAFTDTISGFSGAQTISGSPVVAAGATARFTVQLIAPSTGGCQWFRN